MKSRYIDFHSILFVCLFCFSWVGCNKENENDLTSSIALSKTGSMKLSFDKALAAVEIDTVTALLTRSGYNSISQNLAIGSDVASGTIYNIAEGTWELLIEAKDSTGTVQYRGRASVLIEENRITYVTINLTPASSSGDLVINISWQQGDGISWLKYTANPILNLGATGSWEEKMVTCPHVIYDGSTYKMWYCGVNSSSKGQIGLATSADGINWTKYSGNPVLTSGASGSWEASVGAPTVEYDGTIYKMWYSGSDASSKGRIGFATSTDGITWTKYSGNPVLNTGTTGSWDVSAVDNPSVLYDGAQYKMWFTGYNGSSRRTGYATSPDGKNWTKYAGNPVLGLGASGTWDDVGILGVSVIFTGTEYKMWYSGIESINWKIGYATSSDGINWAKYSGNPIISPSAGTWEKGGTSHPSVLFNGVTYRMWYVGSDSTHHFIGFASSPKAWN